MSENTEYRLPNLLDKWPWSRCLSPYYEEAKEESGSWVRSFLPFNEEGQRAFDACDLSEFCIFMYMCFDLQHTLQISWQALHTPAETKVIVSLLSLPLVTDQFV